MKNKVGCLLSVLCIIVSAFFLYMFIKESRPYIESKADNLAIADTVVKEAENPFNRVVDFEALKKINEDIVGWLYIPGTTVDYPILIGGNNEEYLNKNFKGDYSILGSVFSFADAKLDLSDSHVCLFAHNMAMSQMFGELKKYKDFDYYKEHSKVYIYTPDRTKELDVFSVFTVRSDDEVFSHDMLEGSPEYSSLVEHINNSDTLGIQSKATKEQIFTLATCSGYRNTPYRLTVNCKVVKEKVMFSK